MFALRSWAAAALSAALLAALTVSVATTPAMPRSLAVMGVAAILPSGPPPSGSQLAWSVEGRVHALGVDWVRQDFTRVSPGRIDQRRWDSIFRRAALGHIHLLPLLTGDAYEDHAVIAGAVARYGPGGVFWRRHPRLDASYAATWWEVGNEPWNTTTPETYAVAYKGAVAAARAANPRARFLIAAFSAWPKPGGGVYGSWVSPMYDAVPDLNRYIDGWTDHPYCNGLNPAVWDPGSSTWYWQFKQFTRVHEEFADHGAGDLPMWITEFGYPTNGDRSVDRTRQAKYLQDAVRILGRYAYAQALFVYQLQDWGPRDGDREHYFGVVQADGATKPAFSALQKVAGAR